MLKDRDFEALQKLAKGVAAQFGSDCEVVVHRLSADTMEHSIVAIENGHVTGRKVGDGPSHVVLERLGKTIDRPERSPLLFDAYARRKAAEVLLYLY